MRPSSFRSLLALPFLLLAFHVAPAAAAPPSGLQVVAIASGTDPNYYTQQLQLAKSAGVSFVRTEVVWSGLEPDGPGVRDPAYVAAMDTFFQRAAALNLKVVVTMLETPCWASTAPDSDRKGCSAADKNNGSVTRYPPSDPATYASAAAFVAGRYANQLQGFEVWNEPDQANEFYFAGPDKATRYAAILRAAYPALKAAAPNVPVLGGAIVGANGEFLKALYKAGIKGYYDALSVHYYDLVLASLRYIRSVQKANGDTKPIWLGEFGWTSCYPAKKTQDGHSCVTPSVQAQSIADIYRALRNTKYVLGMVVYTINDTDQYDFGLFSAKNAVKPALGALQSVQKHASKPRSIKLSLKKVGGQVLATGSGPAGDAYELDAFKNGAFRYKLTFRLDRNLKFRLKVPRALGTSGVKVRVYQYWLGGGTLKSI